MTTENEKITFEDLIEEDGTLKWKLLKERYLKVTGKKIFKPALSEDLHNFVKAIQDSLNERLGIKLPFSKKNPIIDAKYYALNALEAWSGSEENKKVLEKYIHITKEGNDALYWEDPVLHKGQTRMHTNHFEILKDFLRSERSFKKFAKKFNIEEGEILTIQEAIGVKNNSMHDIVKTQWDICKDAIDGFKEEHLGTIEQWVEIYKAFPDNCIMLTVKDEIVGYWNFVCINKNLFEKTKDGLLLEYEITIENCELSRFEGDYKAYFMIFAIKKGYDYQRNFQKLFYSFLTQLENLAQNGVFISEWVANGYTKQGKILCEKIGMKEGKENIGGGKMYHISQWWKSTFPFLKDLQKRHSNLVELYKNHFEST